MNVPERQNVEHIKQFGVLSSTVFTLSIHTVLLFFFFSSFIVPVRVSERKRFARSVSVAGAVHFSSFLAESPATMAGNFPLESRHSTPLATSASRKRKKNTSAAVRRAAGVKSKRRETRVRRSARACTTSFETQSRRHNGV